MPLGHDAALELQRRSLEDWIRMMGEGSQGARLFELEGVTASVVPACAERSIVNCATYRDPAGLERALPALAGAYSDAGVRAWTVWVPGGDGQSATALASAGHAFDGEPAAMSLDLADLTAPEATGLDIDSGPDPADVGRVNDLAYGFAVGEGPGPAIGAGPAGIPTRFYAARVDGEPACVVQILDSGDACGVYSVATMKGFRGRGLASILLGAALTDARDRGLRISTLQSSMLGKGVYERLGFGVDFRWQLYERRQ